MKRARITKVTTRVGDGGRTRLAGGREVSKASARIEANGAVDELNAALAVALAGGLQSSATDELRRVQDELFQLGGALSLLEPERAGRGGPTITPEAVARLEKGIERLAGELGALRDFILPGGSPPAAALHLARTVCRRAERVVVRLAEEEGAPERAIVYLNRLSDLLFLLARAENRARGIDERVRDPGA